MKINETNRPWILISAYDVSSGATSEGYVAFNLLKRLKQHYRIVLITRKNNRESLLHDTKAIEALRGIRILGFDLPQWASWWKRGNRLYFPYAYLWQVCWPIALLSAKILRSKLALCHVLNFHNDSIPSLAWILNIPLVWGPINHNELASSWRRDFWPSKVRTKSWFGFFMRRLAWRVDPLLTLMKHKAALIFSAGPWVERRLNIKGDKRIVRLSQLGVDSSIFLRTTVNSNKDLKKAKYLLIHAGRLDWIKGLDIAIEALILLPTDFHLLLVGKGPAEQSLCELVEEKGLSSRVTFMPPVPREKLSEIYKQALLFLFPSAESGGLAWIEALASGLSVVGFNEETFLGCNGYMLPGVYLATYGHDRKSSAQAVAAIVLSCARGQQDAQLISSHALNMFGWDVIANKIIENYRTLLHLSE
ncbi:MAG: glycosyltransferase family 4 protein [Desulfobulbaceae bacterium]|nr:glycosyltransferase family 4 protein [Desulfobulbaceae bacterium]